MRLFLTKIKELPQMRASPMMASQMMRGDFDSVDFMGF